MRYKVNTTTKEHAVRNKFAKLKAQLLDYVEAAEDEFDMTDEDDAVDASAEFAYLLGQIATAYADAGFDVKIIIEDVL
jgi:hypothetical protein